MNQQHFLQQDTLTAALDNFSNIPEIPPISGLTKYIADDENQNNHKDECSIENILQEMLLLDHQTKYTQLHLQESKMQQCRHLFQLVHLQQPHHPKPTLQ